MVNDFDDAFLEKLQLVWPNTIYANSAITYNAVYSSVDNPTTELRFPLLNIYRPNGYSMNQAQNIAARLQGSILDTYKDIETGEIVTARFLVADLEYQIDIYAKTPEELEEISNDLVHMMSLDPVLYVVQKDKTGELVYDETYYFDYIKGPIPDDSFENGDRVYRYALAYGIKSARLINFRKAKLIKDIEVETIVKADTDDTGTII